MQKFIENAFVYIKDEKIYVLLPEGVVFDFSNRITATVTDEEKASVKAMSVTFTDSSSNSETNLTDETGKATVPPIYIDYTDVNGYSEVDGFIVTVKDATTEKTATTNTGGQITVSVKTSAGGGSSSSRPSGGGSGGAFGGI